MKKNLFYLKKLQVNCQLTTSKSKIGLRRNRRFNEVNYHFNAVNALHLSIVNYPFFDVEVGRFVLLMESRL